MINKQTKLTTTKVAFGDVVKLNKDNVKDPVAAGLERYIGLEHLTPEDLRVRSWGNVADGTTFRSHFKPGQVLFGKRRAYQRKVAVADFEGVCSGDIYKFESKDPNVLLPELLPFICQTKSFFDHAVGTSAGSLSPRTNWKQLANYEFALPPLAEQRRIARRLIHLQNVIEEYTKALEKADLLWRSLSIEQFDELNEDIMEPLENHYDIASGQVDPREEAYAKLPLIAPNHIEGETGNLIKLESAEDQGAISGKYLFEKGAVIYSKIRPNLVKVVIAPCRGLSSADMYPLIPKGTIRKEYLLEILLSRRFTRFAVAGSKRTGMPKLNRAYLSKYRCELPNLELQDAYLKKSLSIWLAKANILDRAKAAHKLKQTMLAKVWG